MGEWLTKPIKTPEAGDGSNEDVEYAKCGIQGWKKKMEDKIMIHLNIGEKNNTHLFGIFDGHGGGEVASYARDHFKDIFISLESFKYKEYQQALKETFFKLDEQLKSPEGAEQLRKYAEIEKKYEEEIFKQDISNKESLDTDQINQLKMFKAIFDPRNLEDCNIAMFTGCTACVCYFAENDIFFANVGDSKAIVYSRTEPGENILEAIVRKPNDPEEKKRIEQAEGFVDDSKLNGVVTLSRSIGDLEFKQNEWLRPEDQMVTADPLVNHTNTSRGDYVIIGCNEIWAKKEVVEEIKQKMKNWKENDEGLKEFLQSCIQKNIPSTPPEKGHPGYDNMSCIVINIKEKAKEKKEVIIPPKPEKVKKGVTTQKKEDTNKYEKKEETSKEQSKEKKKEVVMKEIILEGEKDKKREEETPGMEESPKEEKKEEETKEEEKKEEVKEEEKKEDEIKEEDQKLDENKEEVKEEEKKDETEEEKKEEAQEGDMK